MIGLDEKFINENERLRVLRVTFQPGDTTDMHHHPDHMVYVLKGGKAKVTSEGKTQEMDLPEGAAFFLKEQDHQVTNIGNSVVDMLVVEIKR